MLLQKWAQTQVAVGARVACYHDEIKVSLPAIWTPLHHLLFTFYHVDLQTKLEAPKPVSPIVFFPFCVFSCALKFYSYCYLFKWQSCSLLQVVIGYAALPLSTHAQYVFAPPIRH